MFQIRYYLASRLVRGIQVSGRMWFLNKFRPTVIHANISDILWNLAILLIRSFVRPRLSMGPKTEKGSQRADPAIAFRQSSTYIGKPAIFFTEKEINIMAAPFKLSLVGKFSFCRPPIDVIRKSFVPLGLKGNVEISLLDSRHILIQLHLEENLHENLAPLILVY